MLAGRIHVGELTAEIHREHNLIHAGRVRCVAFRVYCFFHGHSIVSRMTATVCFHIRETSNVEIALTQEVQNESVAIFDYSEMPRRLLNHSSRIAWSRSENLSSHGLCHGN